MSEYDGGKRRRKRIVVLGGGFAGAYCAQGLGRRRHRRDLEAVLVDRNNFFVFYPLLVEAGTGSLEPRHVVVPIREFVQHGLFRMGEVLDVDFAGRRVTLRLVGGSEPEEVLYDHLVLAFGSVTRLPDVPGLREHGIEMKSLADAVALRDQAIQLLELANATTGEAERRRLLRLVVVGGNFSGVEVAGEFDEFLRSASRRYPNVAAGDCSVTLVEMGERILAPLGEDLSAFALRHMRKRGIDVRLGTTVTEVASHYVTLSGGETIDTRAVIWCAGIEPAPIIRRLDLPVDERGYILCERDLRVKGMENVWSIGDCAVNNDAQGRAYPATAQHAVRLGTHLTANLARVVRGQPARPCDLRNLGALAAIGCRTGVAKLPGIKLSGFPAWFLWRTVYLLKMPRFSRRVRVALDWTINLFFSRDYVQLGVHKQDTKSDFRGDLGVLEQPAWRSPVDHSENAPRSTE